MGINLRMQAFAMPDKKQGGLGSDHLQQNHFLKFKTPDDELKTLDKLPIPSAQQAIVYFTSSKRLKSNSKSSIETLVSQIDPQNLKKHVEILASDEFAGRKPGTPGIQKAQDYITSEFKNYGLHPFSLITGDKFEQKGYYQQVYKKTDEENPSQVMTPTEAVNLNGKKLEINNVLAYLPAAKKSDEYVLVCAHYDHLGQNKSEIYSGADDNASGVAALLEISRVLAKTKPDKNIIFVATSGEEMGTLGAAYLARQMNAKGLNGKVEVLNMDCLAANGDFMTIEGGAPKHNKRLQQTAIKMADKLDIKYETPPKNDRTDAEAFEKQGFPAITFLWAWMNDYSNRPHYHDPTDKPDIANYENLHLSAKLAIATVWGLTKPENATV